VQACQPDRADGWASVSRLTTLALAEELDRRAKVAELDAYLADPEAEDGPVAEDLAGAAEWADQLTRPSERTPVSRSLAKRPGRSA
jgi:hypothetical protein